MNRKIAILGAGESGAGSAVLAQKKGYRVFVSDHGNIKDNYKQLLYRYDIPFEEGKHSLDKIMDADEVIKSPGIPEDAPVIKQIRSAGIPVISEIEFAGRHTHAKKICITGSNGKTTTSMLTHHILQHSGIDAGLAGNIGKSFAMLVAEEPHDYYVLEISSFQLDGMFDFKADIAILLNITPDHLDRYHHDFDEYAASKFRILQNQTAEDSFVFCLDDKIICAGIEKFKPLSRLIPFTIYQNIEGEGAFLRENQKDYPKSKLCVKINSEQMTMTLQKMTIQGKHNVYNSMAASVAARLVDVRKESIKKCLTNFQGAEHRLEHVATIRGVDYVNDSKATNINSTWFALETTARPVIWIVGGQDKGNNYDELIKVVKEKVKAIVCLGIDNTKIHHAFEQHIPMIFDTRSAEEAVNLAYRISEKDDTVLLSPACASFDLFENFEDRGNQFKNAVLNL